MDFPDISSVFHYKLHKTSNLGDKQCHECQFLLEQRSQSSLQTWSSLGSSSCCTWSRQSSRNFPSRQRKHCFRSNILRSQKLCRLSRQSSGNFQSSSFGDLANLVFVRNVTWFIIMLHLEQTINA